MLPSPSEKTPVSAALFKLNVLEKAKIYYNKCSEAEKNPEIIHQNGKVLQQIYKTVVSATPLQFAFLSNATLEKPSPRELSEIIGYLLREYDVNVFLKLSIKTNWKNPTGLFGHKGYRVFLEQPELKFAKDKDENKWDEGKKEYQKQVKRLFVEFAKVLNKTVDESEIELDAWNVIELERRIAFEARNFDRISKEKQFNVYTKQGAAEEFAFDFTTYFDELSKQLNTDIKENLQGNELEFIITDPSFLQKVEALISSRQTSSRTIYNYIVWKLLENLEVYFPQEKREISVNALEDFNSKCAEKAAENLNDLAARIYLDYKFIYPKKLEELKNEIGSVVEQVVAGFQMQIDKLGWMAESTKEKISKKLRFMARNLLLNDKINIDQYLIDKFDDLQISNSLDYNQITKNINTFNFQQNFNKLLLGSTERDEFLHPITSLNPSYDYEFNSITIPLGLIRRPIYDKDFPTSVKFANFGFLIAKALMKTVDDEGAQWDEIGKLENWMDEKSIDGKAVMEECLANKTKISNEIVIKRVVENGGAIKAAYNAYEAHADLHGQDKLFPDKQFSQLTHDQVFFISYTNIHTENDESAEGVLQNFAAFKSAFYCPAESKYAPKEHCRIWDSEAKAVKGIPPTPPVKSSLEIGNKAVGNSTEYEQVAEFISQRMSVEYSPCENFCEFACSNAKDVDVDLKRSIKENVKERIIQYLETTQSNDELSLRGLQSYSNYFGDDLALPNKTLSHLSSDQLYFLLHTQQYCQKNRIDTFATPNNIKVLGHLRNSEEFRTAYHCKADSLYAPKNFAKVWNSPAKTSVGLPTYDKALPNLNVPRRKPNHSKKYLECAKYFEDSVDNSIDPCEDFYSYTCNNYNGRDTFTDLDLKNTLTLVKSMIIDIKKGDNQAVKKAKTFYNKCREDYHKTYDDVDVAKAVVTEIEEVFGHKFSLQYNDSKNAIVTPEELSYIIGYLSGKYGQDIVVSSMIYTNSRHPNKGYSVYLAAEEFEEESKRKIREIAKELNEYLQYIRNDIDEIQENVLEMATAFVQIEGQFFAAARRSQDLDMRNFSDIYSPITVKKFEEKYGTSFKVKSCLKGLVNLTPELEENITDDDFELTIEDETAFKNVTNELTAILQEHNEYLADYIFYRTIQMANQEFSLGVTRAMEEGQEVPRKRRKGWKRKLPKFPGQGIHYPKKDIDILSHPEAVALGLTAADLKCLQPTKELFNEALNHIFVKTIHPNDTERDDKRMEATKIVDSTLLGFRSMLDQLNWMDGKSKEEAYNKIGQLVKNVAYPNISVDESKLEAYYKDLDISSITDFREMNIKLFVFNQRKIIDDLKKTSFDRLDFGSVFDLNAWYQQAANSITFPLSILQAPFFDPEWPAAVNYGSIGMVAGHELTHGFDDQGIQWDGDGRLQNWISNSSFQSFRKMADCVVDQYSQFCYDQNHCVNGTNTQGENIADNGGIQAAFRAFRNELSLKADAQSLPGEFVGRFTADQLFFLAFGRVWCAAPLSNREREMVLGDVHSPSNFRVLGALRNFPAFRDAFNCPLKKNRSQEKHCQVWITDVEPNLSTPPTTTTAPPINVPQRSLIPANNSAYNEASQGILKSLDLQQDVCNDFHGYVCNNFHTKDLTLKEEATENVAKHILKNLEDDSIQFPHKKLINLYYTSCVEERSAQNSKKKSVEKLLEGLEKVTGSKYPAFEDSEIEISAISEDFLEKSMGFLQGHHNIGSIFDTRVERNLETTPKLIYHHDVYNNDSDEDTRNQIIGEHLELLVEYSKIIGKTPKSLEKLAKDVYYLERLLASMYKNHSLRQTPKYHQNLITLQDLQTELKGIKFNKYFEVMLEKSSEEIRNMFLKDEGLVENRIVSTFGVEHIKEMFRKIYGNQVTDESLLNYFYFRLLWSQRELILNLNSDGLPPNKDDIENTKLSCALQTRDIPILTSRVFLEKQHVVFEVVKDKVLIMTSSLINTLQGLLVESTWMSAVVKARIINKLGALQVNVIADQKIFDNEYLSRYFEGLGYKDDMTSSELKLAVEEFFIAKGYQILNFTSPFQMTEFEATTPEISYDYSKNTLNIPAAAVLAPFYNPEYPFTINFAALGVKIAEHLTHSFDLYGVQIDQNGRFVELDQETSLGYGNLGKCFNKQYGIDANNEFSSVLGHNAAIHIAKQALQLAEDFSGHSPSFADNILRQFTDDQVFYIKYSGQFCDHPNAKNELKRGSNKAKLLNILQNDAEFGTTFNCPANSKYVSENRCELFSIAKTESQDVYIAPEPKVISKLDNSYEKYEKIVKHLNESLDINVDPCNDFYKYTCGKLNPDRKTREQVNLQTKIEAIKAITGAEKSPALRKLRQYFDQCVDFHKNFDDKIRDGTVIKNKVQEFIKQIGNSLRISMYSKSKIRFIPLQHKIISYLQLFEDLQTFVTTTIEVDNRVDGARPGVNPMLLTVDEPTLLWPKGDYIHGWGASKAKKYKEEMLEVLVKFGKIWPNAIVDEAELGSYIDTFLSFERMMTKPAYYTPDREDSQPTIYPSSRMNKFSFLQWTLYTNQLVTYTGLPRLSGARYAVKFENTLLMLSNNIGRLMKNDDRVNYFFMRLLMKYKHLIPGVESPKINAEEECARQTQKLFKFANGKVYINYVSGRKDSTDVLPSLQRMFHNIRSEFRGTIDEIRWISEEDRRFMHKKLLDLHVNWLYPNIVGDINKLDQYYSKVSIGKDYFETTQNLNLDNFRHQMEYLTNANYLEEFENSPSKINGWNRPEYNSLTIPQGLVELADFDKGFPASINYGRLGVQIARELSKVFERPSLQWAHAVRNLTLVTKAFKDKIDEMEKCLIDQYPKEIDVSDVKADNTGNSQPTSYTFRKTSHPVFYLYHCFLKRVLPHFGV
uniref:Peptidase_M13_N domain-containing protein n=1 Tax=Bursaphelenchus xylophilus TaxID=6326 RepID=A0A1I7SFE4_BURXY